MNLHLNDGTIEPYWKGDSMLVIARNNLCTEAFDINTGKTVIQLEDSSNQRKLQKLDINLMLAKTEHYIRIYDLRTGSIAQQAQFASSIHGCHVNGDSIAIGFSSEIEIRSMHKLGNQLPSELRETVECNGDVVCLDGWKLAAASNKSSELKLISLQTNKVILKKILSFASPIVRIQIEPAMLIAGSRDDLVTMLDFTQAPIQKPIILSDSEESEYEEGFEEGESELN